MAPGRPSKQPKWRDCPSLKWSENSILISTSGPVLSTCDSPKPCTQASPFDSEWQGSPPSPSWFGNRILSSKNWIFFRSQQPPDPSDNLHYFMSSHPLLAHTLAVGLGYLASGCTASGAGSLTSEETARAGIPS